MMRTLGLVIKHEIISTAGKRSFWLTTFLLPVVMVAFTLGPQMLAQPGIAAQVPGATAGSGSGDRTRAFGYVDTAGIIEQLPPGLPADALRRYSDEAAARAALGAGAIGGYYLIPADYVRTGELVFVTPEISVISADQQSGQLDYVLRYNLSGDAAVASLLIDPTPSIVLRSLAPATSAAPSSSGDGSAVEPGSPESFVPLVAMFLLFFVITMSAGYMLQSVVKEKENRTAEILLVSLRPRDLMLGKVVGLGLIALFQMGIWIGGGMLFMGGGQQVSSMLRGATLSPGFVAWAILFFLGGFVVYSSALGALGALAPNMREGSQFTFIFLIPLLLPVWLNSVFLHTPNGVLATVFSLFPLTAPTAMVSRLAAGGVPAWQAPLALIGVALTAYLFVTLAARFFRADTLLSSGSLSWGRIAGELRRR
jgi:ABC-2 type transport system permease protein